MLIKTAGLVDVLARALKPLGAKLQTAFVYGSIAEGTEESDSDIDFMAVGQLSPADLALSLRRAPELLGREINPTVYTPSEFEKKRKAQGSFLKQVLDEPRLFVLGNNDELGRVTGG